LYGFAASKKVKLRAANKQAVNLKGLAALFFAGLLMGWPIAHFTPCIP
jgi:hypothetical protein